MNETQPQTATPTMLDWLFDHWWILLLVAVVLLLVLLYVLLVRARRTESEAAEEEPAGEQEKASTPFAKKDPEVDGLKTSFEKSLERLKAYVPGAKYRLQLPWYLLIGEEGLGKTTLLENVELPLPMGAPSHPYRHDVNWWFFQDAVVLDVPGDYLLAHDPGATRNRLWNAFLRLLQRHRRRRPIDGVILALPGPDLFGPEALTPEVIDYKAEQIYEKLLDAQRILGLRFPIYVLFTGCDCIPSYQGYLHELPPAYRDTIFGWSNPYSLDTVYSSDWADEAFDTLAETLYRSQVELMADGMASDNADGFFLFPTEFQQLRDPVRHYLDRIFKTSAYHDAFYLRGVYFTGDGAGDSAGERSLAPALLSNNANGTAVPANSGEPSASETLEYRPRPAFVTQLFDAKIFPEFKLAGPISQIFRWRHRTARSLQWASLLVFLIWGIGLLFAYNRLDSEINGNGSVGLIDVLPEIDQDLVAARRYLNNEEQEFGPDQEAQFVDRTLRLIEVFADLHASTLWSVFIPASWFSTVDEDVGKAFSLAYEKVVFQLLRHELEQQANALIGANYRAPPLRRPPLLRLVEQPRFYELRQFVQEMAAFETQATRYNRFDDSREKDLTHFGGIVEYLLRNRVPPYKMPSGFYDDADLYAEALGSIRIDSFQFGAYQPQADGKAENMVARLYVDLFANNVLFVRLRQLERRLQTLRNIDDETLSPAQETDTLFQTLRLIQDVEFWLDDPTLVYLQYKTGLDTDTLSLAELIGPAFEELVARMESSPFFNPDRGGYRALSWHALEQAQKQMLALEIPPTTQHMLVPGQERALELSPDLLEVKNAIIKLLDQHAADTKAPRRIPGFQDGYSLFWNLDLLEEALALQDQYEDLNTSSEKVLVTVLMTDRVARAATFVFDPAAFDPNASEEELRPQIQNFAAALPHLTKLLNVFQVLGARDQRLALAQLASVQAYTLLEQVYALLWASGRQGGVRRPFYSLDVAGANWTWKHGEPLYTPIFNTDEATTVDAYLAAQRERVMYLNADFASPLLVMLNSHNAQYAPKPPDLVSDWNQIAQALQEYAQQQPGNSLSRLESFVGQVMQTTTPDSCLQVLAAPTPYGEDYFLDRLLEFKVDLHPVCRGVALAEATTEYEGLRAEFDNVIARRYPFGVQPTGDQVDPETLRRFFNEYDQFALTYLPYVEDNPDEFDPGLLAFFREMAQVRAFYAPFLDNEDEKAPPQYDFDIDFRVNLYREVSGSNIIEWQLMVDDRVIGIRDTVRTGSWTYDEPVRLVLRWAKDGPLAPVDAGQPNVYTDVEARRVTFEYLNRWALLAFLDQHRRRPFDPNPITLEFRIPVRPVGASEQVVPDTSVVFLRMVVRPPGSNEVLDFPTSFPRRVP